VLSEDAVPVVREYGAALAVPHDTSIAQLVAEAAPVSALVVRAFSTIFRNVLGRGRRAGRVHRGR
jgi:predicted dinucleotide-binding enzyme